MESRSGHLVWQLGCVVFNEVCGLYEMDIWKNIKKGWREFYGHPRFEVGDGSKSRF
jgi:hypothetical protein